MWLARTNPEMPYFIREYFVTNSSSIVNGWLIFAILGIRTVKIHDSFMFSLNFVHFLPLRYTPSTRHRCIAGNARLDPVRALIDRLI